MKFAEFENTRIEVTPGATGFCPGCKAALDAKCGDKNIWHWAHRSRKHCDFFREPETEWHRNWKDRFPPEWQEVSSHDEHGELHIADVKAPNGYVVEFQHSPIKIDEVKKRTKQKEEKEIQHRDTRCCDVIKTTRGWKCRICDQYYSEGDYKYIREKLGRMMSCRLRPRDK